MGIHRNQFTFYASFLAAAEQLPPKLRSEFLLILCRYALDEIEPETRSSTVKTAFELVRPVLDKARRKAMAGKSGGEASGEIRSKPEANRSKTKQTGSRPEAEETALYSEGEEEKEKEKEYEYEGEEEGGAPPMRADHEAFSPVLDALAQIGEKVSDKMETDVGRICAEYGTKAVLDAIYTADKRNVRRWSYIRAIVTSGGVRQAGGQDPSHYIHHGEPLTPCMVDAARRMLEEPDDPGEEPAPQGLPDGAALAQADELLPEAVEVVLDTGAAQTSILQRRLQIGYGRAARILDEMEERGIVGPLGAAPRKVLISREDWEAVKRGTDPSLQTE